MLVKNVRKKTIKRKKKHVGFWNFQNWILFNTIFTSLTLSLHREVLISNFFIVGTVEVSGTLGRYLAIDTSWCSQTGCTECCCMCPLSWAVSICSHRSNICCPRDCVSRHNGGTSGAPLKPLRDDSALRVLSTLRGLRVDIYIT